MLQLERLRAGPLKDVPVIVVVPDTPEEIREALASLEAKRRIRLTHRFYSRPRVRTIHRGKSSSSASAMNPSLVLYEQGAVVWRFDETEHRKRPSDHELKAAIKRLTGRTQ